MLKYQLISRVKHEEFERECTDLLNRGFVPIGSVAIARSDSSFLYAQAFISKPPKTLSE